MTELPKIKAEDLDDVIARVRDAVFDTGKECETCKGSGTVFPGRRVIHSVRGGMGADWDEEDVVEAVKSARARWWGPGTFDLHDLAVQEADRSWVMFRVPHPDRKREQ